jgi:proteasome lid subunit RPN8/RPN11
MITIEPQAHEAMLADAQVTFPDECCGFMFGKDDGNDRTIVKVTAVNNSKDGDKRRRYEVSPFDYMKAEQYADDTNLQLLGVYHSHPNHPSIPSETDRINAQPFFSYIIISVMEGRFNTIQSWRLNDQSEFEEEIIHKHR